MSAITSSCLLVLTGACGYAAISHLSVGLRRPFDHSHLLLAGMCLALIGFGLSEELTYQAHNIPAYVTALKWNLSFVVAGFVLFPWFIGGYTDIRPLPWLAASSVMFAVLFVINLLQPYSIQYTEITGLKMLRLPWGETVTQPLGRSGAVFWLGVTLVLSIQGFALYALAASWRRNRMRTTLAMLLAVGLLMVTAIEGAFVRSGAIEFIHLGPFGFLVTIIVMSRALSRDTRRRLLASERRFRSLVEQSPFSIQVVAPDGYTRQVNPAWEKLWGIKAEAIGAYNILEDRQLLDKGVMPYIEQGFAGTPAEIPPVVYNPADNPQVRGPVRDRWVRAFIYPIKDDGGRLRDVILMHQDVTDKKRVEDAMRLIAAGVSSVTGEQFFQQLVLNLTKVFDADYAFIGRLVDGGQRVTTLAICAHGRIAPDLSYAVAGTPCADVVGHATCAYPRDVQRLFPHDPLLAEMDAEGYIGAPLFDARREPLGLVVVLDSKPLENVEQMKDILEISAGRAGAELQRQQAEARIRHMAYHDYLTGLASRAQLDERLSEALGEAQRTGVGGALLLIDLDHFKIINDALGHDVGDALLKAVARRLTEVVAGDAFVARFGGDEFIALMEAGASDTAGMEEAARGLAQRIMESLASPIFLGERAFSVGASIGVALFPANNDTVLDVLRHADMALYRAKSMGRGMVQLYLPSLQTEAASRLHLDEGLRRALSNNELELYYQPQLDAEGRVTGAEALLRWHHPDLGSVPPVTFIPVAEETGLIHTLGSWVLEQACARLGEWQQAGLPFTGDLSVNVSPWQFARPDFVEELRKTLDAHKTDPRRLMLELTETALLYDLDESIEKLKALRALGLTVALDDFGTGYSSLAYLRDLPLDQIKIDKSFVGELGSGSEHPLVGSMIAIGQHMALEVVAEGVETEAQRATLLKLGCRMLQGFLFCQPMPEHAFLQWLDANAGSDAVQRS